MRTMFVVVAQLDLPATSCTQQRDTKYYIAMLNERSQSLQ